MWSAALPNLLESQTKKHSEKTATFFDNIWILLHKYFEGAAIFESMLAVDATGRGYSLWPFNSWACLIFQTVLFCEPSIHPHVRTGLYWKMPL
jgi:hypothetical protein